MFSGTDLSKAYINRNDETNKLEGVITLSQLMGDCKDAVSMKNMFTNCTYITYVYSHTSEPVDGTYVLGSYTSVLPAGENSSYIYKYTLAAGYEYDKVYKPVTGFVKDMNSMFSYCSSLKGVDLQFFNLSQCLDMRYMFSNCTSLEYITFGRYHLHNECRTEYIFENCTSLTYVFIPWELKDNFLNISQQAGNKVRYYKYEFDSVVKEDIEIEHYFENVEPQYVFVDIGLYHELYEDENGNIVRIKNDVIDYKDNEVTIDVLHVNK